jgi:hypothetical protein
MVVQASHPKLHGRLRWGRSGSRLAWAESKTVSKITREKRAGGVAHTVECLSSNFRPTKTKKSSNVLLIVTDFTCFLVFFFVVLLFIFIF